MRDPRLFLSAEWRYLAMLNYAVDPKLLTARVPPGTELDLFEGQAFVSLVAFRFLRTRLLGFRVPFHEDFEEVNLRFYVRRRADDGWRRGVTFIRELVPRPAIAFVARLAFNENYVAAPMSHEIRDSGDGAGRRVSAEYGWVHRGNSGTIRMSASGIPLEPRPESLERFITEHYWGYALRKVEGSLEYEVRHDPWRVWSADAATFTGEASELYGSELSRLLARKPDSAFLADGSPVAVFAGRRIA